MNDFGLLLAFVVSGMIMVIMVILHARRKVGTVFIFVTFIHVRQLKTKIIYWNTENSTPLVLF